MKLDCENCGLKFSFNHNCMKELRLINSQLTSRVAELEHQVGELSEIIDEHVEANDAWIKVYYDLKQENHDLKLKLKELES